MSYGAQARLKERSRRRAVLLRAAETLYAEQGWPALSMEQVARGAGLSRPLLYLHFKDKNELHLAIVARALALFARRFRASARRPAAGLDTVTACIDTFAATASDKPHYFDACARFYFRGATHRAASEAEAACLRRTCSILQTIAAAIVAGRQDGTVRADGPDPLSAALSLWAFMLGTLQIAQNHRAPLAARRTGASALVEQLTRSVRCMLQSSAITR